MNHKELASALTGKFGPAYIPHKLSEECLELSIAIHKIRAISMGFSKAPTSDKELMLENLLEEIAHVKVFMDLFEVELLGNLERVMYYYDERYERLKTKLS